MVKTNKLRLIGRCILAGAVAFGLINISGCVTYDDPNPVAWTAPNNINKKYVNGQLNPRFKNQKNQNYRPIEQDIGATVLINELYNPKIFKR